jgi:hypothetical protein
MFYNIVAPQKSQDSKLEINSKFFESTSFEFE